MSAEVKPWRISTDSRPDWKVRARTHGPIRAKTLIQTMHYGTVPPAATPMELHERMALALAVKIAGEGASVHLYSASPTGNAFDWSVRA